MKKSAVVRCGKSWRYAGWPVGQRTLKVWQSFLLRLSHRCHMKDVATHGVMRAWPVGQRTFGSTSGTSLHATRSCGPAARWIAPSTPPPPSRRSFAALRSKCLSFACSDEVGRKLHAKQTQRIAECRNEVYPAVDTDVRLMNGLPALRMA
jgi:hypothetical protein